MGGHPRRVAQGQNSRVGSLPCTDGLQSGELEKGESRDPSKVPALQCVVAASTDREHYATANGFYASGKHRDCGGNGVSRGEQFVTIPDPLLFSCVSARAIRIYAVQEITRKRGDDSPVTAGAFARLLGCSPDSAARALHELARFGFSDWAPRLDCGCGSESIHEGRARGYAALESGEVVPHATSASVQRAWSLGRRDGWACRCCGIPLTVCTATVDHVVPTSRGGGDALNNLVLACSACNSVKGARVLS